jgi:hypothetical protein
MRPGNHEQPEGDHGESRRHSMTTARTTIATGLAMLLSLSIASAAFAIGEDEEDPAVRYCQALVELSASVEALGMIDAGTTVGEFETAVDDVREAATNMEESLRGLVEAQIAALETAVGDLQGYRDSLEEDQTIEEVVLGAGTAIAAVASARAEVGTIPNCAVVAGQEAAEEEAEE